MTKTKKTRLRRAALFLSRIGSECNEVKTLMELLDQAQSAEPVQGEAVEVVGYVAQQDMDWQGDCTLRKTAMADYTIPVMTVAQHNRSMAAAKPDAEMVALLRDERNYGPLGVSCQVGMVERCVCKMCRIRRIDAKLAEVNKP